MYCRARVDTTEEVEAVNRFYYLGDRLNTSGVCAAAIIARTQIEWLKFRECGEVL